MKSGDEEGGGAADARGDVEVSMKSGDEEGAAQQTRAATRRRRGFKRRGFNEERRSGCKKAGCHASPRGCMRLQRLRSPLHNVHTVGYAK